MNSATHPISMLTLEALIEMLRGIRRQNPKERFVLGTHFLASASQATGCSEEEVKEALMDALPDLKELLEEAAN